MEKKPKKRRFKVSDLLIPACRVGHDPHNLLKLPKKKINHHGMKLPNPSVRNGTASTKFCQAPNTDEMLEPETEELPHDGCDNEHELQTSEGRVISTLSTEETYLHLLIEADGIFPVDSNFAVFVLLDLCESTSTLQKNSFVIVQRVSKEFSDGLAWVFHCSCNPDREAIIGTMDSYVDIALSDFALQFPECIHCKVLFAALTNIDTLHDIPPVKDVSDHKYTETKKLKETSTVMSFGPTGAVLVQSDVGLGVVTMSVGDLVCTCVKRRRCCHTMAVQKEVDEGGTAPLDHLVSFNALINGPRSHETSPVCFSWKKIPFILPSHLQAVLHMETEIRFSGLQVPVDEGCTCQNCGVEEQHSTKYEQIPVISLSDIIHTTVAVNTCKTCGYTSHHDGQALCLLNMGKFMVSYDVLRRFMWYFLIGKSTMYSEHTVLIRCLLDHGFSEAPDTFSYNRFRWSWYSFLELLDVDLSEGFQCSECGPQPSVVIMDATTLSFRKKMLSWSQVLQEVPAKSDLPKGSSHHDRIYIKNTKLRKVLRNFCRRGLDRNEYQEMIDLLEQENKEMAFLIKQLMEDYPQIHVVLNKYKIPPEFQGFFLALSSDSPVCTTIHPKDFFNLYSLFKCDSVNDPSLLKWLQETCPILFRIVSVHGTRYFKEILALLPSLEDKSIGAFPSVPFISSDSGLDENKTNNDLSFFPSLPTVRRRGMYQADVDNVSRLGCRKRAHGHPVLLPGVFTLLCPHGVCYGFEVMKAFESPNTPFTLLRERFLKAPSLVVYDNACNLQRYCLNRDPAFFRDTTFRIDGLHWEGHTSCSPAYELKSYPQHQELNSQAAEQLNAHLKRLKGLLAYMTKDHFLKHLKFYIWGKNNKVLNSIE